MKTHVLDGSDHPAQEQADEQGDPCLGRALSPNMRPNITLPISLERLEISELEIRVYFHGTAFLFDLGDHSLLIGEILVQIKGKWSPGV